MDAYETTGDILNGRLRNVDRQGLQEAIARFANGPVVLRLSTPSESRSAAQNRFFHGPVLNAFMTLGYHKQEAKDILALHFIPIDVRQLDGTIFRVPGHTSTLTKQEFTDFIEACIQLAAEQGIVIEDADQWRQNH